MIRRFLLMVIGFGCLAGLLAYGPRMVHAQQRMPVQWIWLNEGDPAKEAPAETRYFRRVFNINRPIQKPVDEAELDITADDEFTVFINGVEIGKGNAWKRVYRFDVQKYLVDGKNVIAVRARNAAGAAGLLARLGYVPNGMSKLAVVSDGSWKAAKAAPAGWEKVEFDDGKWDSVKVLGPFGPTGPWQGVIWDAGGDDRFSVPPGFVVEPAVALTPKGLDPKLPFSLINLTIDAKGRLLISQERGPILLCTGPDQNGVLQEVKPYCAQVKSSQGMCWVNDALLLVGDGPQGTGLYRVRDTDGDDKTDEVKLLHKFRGGMGEHGPHAIIHGPDNWLYLVIGNHAWANLSASPPSEGGDNGGLADNSPLRRWPTGGMGPDQGKPKTNEDVLLPRLNDSRGHAANILAPGGTIWRLDHEGKNMSLVTAGFRNHFDAAFSPNGELFTFDSDMEWDEDLPWYRAVRVCHCPPGADFVWRTGAANTPDYYIDSLPPAAETGRGSPVGVEFYDHTAFPEKYRGACFLADWAIGTIFACHLERNGASYKGKVERFCQGAPMNVTDLVVGPDGAMYFTMGGRGSQGGVYRIVYRGVPSEQAKASKGGVRQFYRWQQPLAAWSRAELAKYWSTEIADRWHTAVKDERQPARARIKVLDSIQAVEPKPGPELCLALLYDKSAEMRAHAVWHLGVAGYKEGREAIIAALKEEDPLVRRRACEALIRAGFEPPIAALWPLLRDNDRFVRTAARLVLQRIEPDKWIDRLAKEKDTTTVLEAIVALCKTNQVAPHISKVKSVLPELDRTKLLDILRVAQLVVVHAPDQTKEFKDVAERCNRLFPHDDGRVNRELAILMTHFRREKVLDVPVQAKLLDALLAAKHDRLQQIHYFYCLRLLHDGWTPEQRERVLDWYDATKTWTGGHSFTPFLENIFRDLAVVFTAEDRNRVLAKAEQQPWAATALLRLAPENDLPSPGNLAELYSRLAHGKPGAIPQANELREALVTALGKGTGQEAQAALRKIADDDPSQRDTVARSLARSPSPENWRYLVGGLDSSNPVVVFDAVQGLKKIATTPKPDEPRPYRALLEASGRLTERNRWQAVELLRHWSSDRRFGADKGNWKTELTAWSRWFGQAFPKEPPLIAVALSQPVESKYKFDELLAFLEKEPAGQNGNPKRGRQAFEKAQCLKCHKYGAEGEGIGPDLTTVSKRFKRADILEALVYPSKAISDQYRSVLIQTTSGQQITGLAAPQGDTVTVLLSDGTKVTLTKSEIDQQFASLISVMPERLLDALTKEEIADLFAFMESEAK